MYYCDKDVNPSDLSGLGADPVTDAVAGATYGIVNPIISAFLPESAETKAKEKMLATQAKMQTEMVTAQSRQAQEEASASRTRTVVYAAGGLAALLVGGIVLWSIMGKRK